MAFEKPTHVNASGGNQCLTETLFLQLLFALWIIIGLNYQLIGSTLVS